jgi:hypothetical protein
MYWCLPVFRMIIPFCGRGICVFLHSVMVGSSFVYAYFCTYIYGLWFDLELIC